MSISTNQALPLLTNRIAKLYREQTEVKGFLRSFFPTNTNTTRYVSIEVERENEKIAVDVVRGSDGNRNTMSRSTQKTFEPNYYHEYFDMAELDVYNRAVGSEVISASVFAELAEKAGKRVMKLQNKIDRAGELQCAQALQSGIVTSVVGTNIDYKRKSASMVDLGANNYWADSGVDPKSSILTGCEFLRATGKAQGAAFNMIMGSKALADLLNNPKIQASADNRRYMLDSIMAPQREAVGSVYHGTLSVGSWIVHLWTYPEYYTDAAGVQKQYVEPENAILLPEKPNFSLEYAAVPQLVGQASQLQEGKYLLQRFTDARAATDEWDMKSAFLAIPTAIDQIYTIQAVAS